MTRCSRWVTPLALGLATLALTAVSAQAQDIQIIGNAMGCFGLGCTPVDNTGPLNLGGVTLEYASLSPGDFVGTTTGGNLAINGTTGSFGTITLGAAPNVPVNTPFTLLLNFLTPTMSGPAAMFAALIQGTATTDPTSGGVQLSFTSGPLTRSFTNGIPGDVSGTMTVLANSTALPPGNTTQITGFITASAIPSTTTPEPVSMALLGTGLLGLAGVGRRRRRQMAAM